jgi:dTDP-4-dehydrorhamnose 3,5-epimerase
MNINELEIPGCYQITPNVFRDERGEFVKTFHKNIFSKYNIDIELKEEFYSISKKYVLRGLHFQLPPSAHKKIVYCAKGTVLDFFVDLRIGSPTFGRHLSIVLSSKNAITLFLPIGIAHGFLSLEDDSLMVYKTDCCYDPIKDSGLEFYSCGIKLPIDPAQAIISDRDRNLTSFEKFNSEFTYA